MNNLIRHHDFRLLRAVLCAATLLSSCGTSDDTSEASSLTVVFLNDGFYAVTALHIAPTGTIPNESPISPAPFGDNILPIARLEASQLVRISGVPRVENDFLAALDVNGMTQYVRWTVATHWLSDPVITVHVAMREDGGTGYGHQWGDSSAMYGSFTDVTPQ